MTPLEKIQSAENSIAIRPRQLMKLNLLRDRIEQLYSLQPGDLQIVTHARNISEPRKLFAYIACRVWKATTDDTAYYIACKRSNVSTQAKNWEELCDRFPTYAAMTNIVEGCLMDESRCNCEGGPKGRSVTEDFEHQVCEQCGRIAN